MSITSLTGVGFPPWQYLVSGGIVLALSLALMAYLTWRPRRRNGGDDSKEKSSLENKLTFLVAVIIAAICAQGMGRFFYDQLHFPIELVIVVGGVLELTAFTCALRARRNILDEKVGKAGVDGIAVWVVTALSGGFSAMDAGKPQVAVFRLVMPLLAAWLWERGMSIERRRVRGGSTIHWRVTPERVLVWLRIAEPSGRTASEVDAHRRLTRVAKAAAAVKAHRAANHSKREAWAQARLDRAMRSAVAHAGLAADPARQRLLLAQLGAMYNADALANLTPDAPWAGFTTLVQRTGFAVQGREFTPVRFTSPAVQVRAEVQQPVPPQVHGTVQGEVHEPAPAEVHGTDVEVHEPQTTAANEEPANQVRERDTSTPKAAKTRTVRTTNLDDRAKRKANEVRDVVNLIHELGYDNVTLDVVRERLKFAKTTAYHRLTKARELVNQSANQKAVNQ